MIDEVFMLRAIELAKNGVGKVNPNPLVGAVIVKGAFTPKGTLLLHAKAKTI